MTGIEPIRLSLTERASYESGKQRCTGTAAARRPQPKEVLDQSSTSSTRLYSGFSVRKMSQLQVVGVVSLVKLSLAIDACSDLAML